MEEWKDIEGYEGYYQVSNYGRVKSLGRYQIKTSCTGKVFKTWQNEKIMKLQSDKDGYSIICLKKNGVQKNPRINRLVAKAFIPNPNNLPQVNHKDEDKKNNYVDNLEWCTIQYNMNYGTRNERHSKFMMENTFAKGKTPWNKCV